MHAYANGEESGSPHEVDDGESQQSLPCGTGAHGFYDRLLDGLSIQWSNFSRYFCFAAVGLAVESCMRAGSVPRGKADDWRTTRCVGMCHSFCAALGWSGSMPARRACTAAVASSLHDICTVVRGGSMNWAR